METFKVQFTIGKETKNTFKFDEVSPPGKSNVMQSIYLPKWLLHGRNVETVTVTFQLPKAA